MESSTHGEHCQSCGRVLAGKLLFKAGHEYCTQCTDEDGNLLAFEDVMQHYIDFLSETEQMNIEEALIQARLTLVNQPAWSDALRADDDRYIGG